MPTSLQVSWEKPVDTGCPEQTIYKVHFWKESNRLPCGHIANAVKRNTITTNKTMITLNNLYPNSKYFVNVYMNGDFTSMGNQIQGTTLMKGRTS